MDCETLGLKRWTCSRLCPSRSGNGIRGLRPVKLLEMIV